MDWILVLLIIVGSLVIFLISFGIAKLLLWIKNKRIIKNIPDKIIKEVYENERRRKGLINSTTPDGVRREEFNRNFEETRGLQNTSYKAPLEDSREYRPRENREQGEFKRIKDNL